MSEHTFKVYDSKDKIKNATTCLGTVTLEIVKEETPGTPERLPITTCKVKEEELLGRLIYEGILSPSETSVAYAFNTINASGMIMSVYKTGLPILILVESIKAKEKQEEELKQPTVEQAAQTLNQYIATWDRPFTVNRADRWNR